MAIKTSLSDGIAEVYLDHPPVNALDSGGWRELAETITDRGSREDVRVLIIAAEGRGFCAGVDIKELAADSARIVEVNRGNYDTFAAIRDCPVPVIAAVHGFVLGGGVGIAGSADILIATRDAFFGLPEIDRGAMGAATHLLRLVSPQKARRMFFTGESLSAEEVYRFGSIEELVDHDELVPRARRLATKIAAKSPDAMRLAKESINGIDAVDLKRNYRFEQGFTFQLYASPDSQEARDAFVEKRNANFGD